MRKSFHFFLVVLAALSLLASACGSVTPIVPATDTPIPLDFSNEKAPTLAPSLPRPGPVPTVYISPSASDILYKQPPRPNIPRLEEKTLVVMVLDKSASMNSCDPGLKNSKAMARGLAQMISQYYDPFNSSHGDLLDFLLLRYPASSNRDAIVGNIGDKNALQQVLQEIDKTQAGGENVFYADMFKEIQRVSQDNKYSKIITLIWTDGVFLPGGGAQHPIESQQEYQNKAKGAFDDLPSNVLMGVFFPCETRNLSDADWWRGREQDFLSLKRQTSMLLPWQGDVGSSWLKWLTKTDWFKLLFPGFESAAPWQQLLLFYEGTWHNFSGTPQSSSGQISGAATDYMAGLVHFSDSETGPNSYSFSFDGVTPGAIGEPLSRMWNGELRPLEVCAKHRWDLKYPQPSSPAIFWLIGNNDLDFTYKIESSPALVFGDGDPQSQAPFSASWNAWHIKKQQPPISADEMMSWENCYQPIFLLEQYVLPNVPPMAQDGVLRWSILPEQIGSKFPFSSSLPPGGHRVVPVAFTINYIGEDGNAVAAAPADKFWKRSQLQIGYFPALIDTDACTSSSTLGVGNLQTEAKPFTFCKFTLLYGAFGFIEPPGIKVWFTYDPAKDSTGCLAPSKEYSIPLNIQNDYLSITEIGRSADQTQSVYEIKNRCKPKSIWFDFGDGRQPVGRDFSSGDPTRPWSSK